MLIFATENINKVKEGYRVPTHGNVGILFFFVSCKIVNRQIVKL